MIKKIIMALALALPMSMMAQKFGTFDYDAVITTMPEYTEMQNQITETSKKYESEFMKLQEEVNKLVAEYQTIESDPNTPQSIKDLRLQEVQNRYTKVQQFRETAEQDMARLQQQLATPIQQKLNDAVASVGSEGGFTFIFPQGIALYSGTDVIDATPLVRAKLGI